MTYLYDFVLFSGKSLIVLVTILLIVAGVLALLHKGKTKQQLDVTHINKKLTEIRDGLQMVLLDKKTYKAEQKAQKKEQKTRTSLPRTFVLTFDGDIKASQAEHLREEITAILTVVKPEDEVLVKLNSPGGMVHGYGLAAAQLERLRTRNIRLTVAVDAVAASGGYMMACVADHIIAAPFAIIGSIGAVVQLPNFNKWLAKHDIEFEQLTAGEFKRPLSVFGKNTDKGREKMQQELEVTHELFKRFIRQHRPQVDINQVATGEHWFGTQAKDFYLVDDIITSDDYLLAQSKQRDIYHIHYYMPAKSWLKKLFHRAQVLC